MRESAASAEDAPVALGPVNLARRPDFDLGSTRISPATRTVSGTSETATVEPMVMQVLLALIDAGGAVVTRDDLIRRCWSGRFVGEDAVNRVIGEVRRVARTVAEESFSVETIPKTGYRLVVDGGAGSGRARIAFSRRTLVAGSLAIGAALGAPFLWTRWEATRHPSPVAREFYERGMAAQRQWLANQTSQAEAYFLRAVETDPEFPEAWGALAMTYRNMVESGQGGDQAMLAERSRSAARRALELDPDNIDARVALLTVPALYRRWYATQRELERLSVGHPDHSYVQSNLGKILADAGRWNESIPPLEKSLNEDDFLPHGHARLGIVYWGAGRLQKAESVLTNALRLWPSHPAVWFTLAQFLAYSGKPDAARAMVENAATRPTGVPPEAFANLLVEIRALQTRTPADIDAAVAQALATVKQEATAVLGVASLLGTLQMLDLLFPMLESFYLGIPSPHIAKPPAIGPLTRRPTSLLFLPTVEPLRADSRFASLTRRIGLDDYWRQTGSTPDYLRS